MQQSRGRVKLTEVNPHLVCVLCHGYFIDATTMAECAHSFCRSCIVLYLETKSYCPICEVQVHKTKPHLNLKPDKTLQDIVYKLVPGLYHEEMRRRRQFYADYPNRDLYLGPEARGVGVERIIYSPEDLISLSLEYYDKDREKEEWASTRPGARPVVLPQKISTPGEGLKRYLQCPAVVTMGHLKKFIRLKYGLTAACTVEILYGKESLPDSYSLMDVAYIYTWKRNGPIRFYYRIQVPTTLRTILPPLKPSSEPIRDTTPQRKPPGSELLDAVGLRPKPPEPSPENQRTELQTAHKGVENTETEAKEKMVASPETTTSKGEKEKERSDMSPEENDAVSQLLALSNGHVSSKPSAQSTPVVTTDAVHPATPSVATSAPAPPPTSTGNAEPAKPVTGNGNVFKVPQSMTKRFVFNGGKLVAVKNKQPGGRASGKPGDKVKVNGKLSGDAEKMIDRFANPLGLSGVHSGKLPPGSPRPPPNSEKIMRTKYMPPTSLLMSRLPEVTLSQNDTPPEPTFPQKPQVPQAPQVSSSQSQSKQSQRPTKVNANGNSAGIKSNVQPSHRKECNRLEQIVQNCLKKETTQKKDAEVRSEANGVKRSGTLNGKGEATEGARAASSIRPPDHVADRVDSVAQESSILKRKLNEVDVPGEPKKRRLVTPDVSIELTTHPAKDKQHKTRVREPSDLSTLTKRFLHDIQRTSLKKIDADMKINSYVEQMCASTVKIEKVPAPPSQIIAAPKSSPGGAEKSKPIDSTDFSSEDDQLFIDIRNKCEAMKRKSPEPVSIAIERVSEDPKGKTAPGQTSPPTTETPSISTTNSPMTTSPPETSPKPSGTHKKLPRLIEINAPPRPKIPPLVSDPKQKTGIKMTTVRKEVPIGKEVPLVRRDSNGALDLSSGMSPPSKNGSKSPYHRPSPSEKSPTPSALSPLLAMTSFPMPDTNKSSPIRIPTLKPKTSPNPRPSSLSSSSPSPPAEPRAASEVFPSTAYQQLYRHQMELQSRFLASQVNNNNWSRDPLSAKKFEEWMRNVMKLPHHPLMFPSQVNPEAGRK